MTRHLTHLTWPQVRDLDKRRGVVVLPIGATEQHGPHLPLLTDTRQVEAVLEAALKQLPADVRVWTLPALPYSKSVEHARFPGTVALGSATLTAVLSDIARSVAAAGFRRLALLNGHGGNVGLLDSLARDIRLETGLLSFCIHPAYWLQPTFDTPEQEQRLGIHAGELETSLMLKLGPDLVDMTKAVTYYPELATGDLGLFGAASAAWLTGDWSESGVFGDATLGTADKGAALLQTAAERLATLLTDISSFEVPGEG